MARITERGWPGHFICADRCLFRRNTLVEGGSDRVVISTVGGMRKRGGGLDTLGAGGRYYETMAFGAKDEGGYVEADVSDQRAFNSEGSICADSPGDLPDNVDNHANAMHEAVVREIASAL